MTETSATYLSPAPHLVSLALAPATVDRLEAALCLINVGLSEDERPYGLADLVEAAVAHALGRCHGGEAGEWDEDDWEWLGGYFRGREAT